MDEHPPPSYEELFKDSKLFRRSPPATVEQTEIPIPHVLISIPPRAYSPAPSAPNLKIITRVEDEVSQPQPGNAVANDVPELPPNLAIFEEPFSNLPIEIQIKEAGDGKGSHNLFYLRNARDNLLFTASVALNIILQNLASVPVLRIEVTRDRKVGFPANVGDMKAQVKFMVHHQGRPLGTLTLSNNDIKTFKIVNDLENRPYWVNFVNETNAVICRRRCEPVMAQIHIEVEHHYGALTTRRARHWTTFNGSINFTDLVEGISTVDRALVFSLALAMIKMMKEQEKTGGKSSNIIYIIIALALSVLAVLIFFFVFLKS